MSTAYSRYDKDNTPNVYLNEVLAIPRLSSEEEKELLMQYASGDTSVKTRLIEGNLRLVLFVAKKYYEKGLFLEDIIQEGNLGLQKAIETYDLSKGIKLSTYAVTVIEQYIIDALRRQTGAIYIPKDAYVKIKELKSIEEKLFQKYHREPSLKEIAAEMNIDMEEAQILYQNRFELISLNRNIFDEDSDEFEDFYIKNNDTPENIVMRKFYIEEIRNLIINAPLKQKELDILFMHYGIDCEPMSLRDIGKKYHVSQEAVRKTEERAFKKIKKFKKEI